MKDRLRQGLAAAGVIAGFALGVHEAMDVREAMRIQENKQTKLEQLVTGFNSRITRLDRRSAEDEMVLCLTTLINRPTSEEQDTADCLDLVQGRTGIDLTIPTFSQ